MSLHDRLSLLLQAGLYLFSFWLCYRAFGPAKRRPLQWHLEKNDLTLTRGGDAEFVIKSQQLLSDKEFDSLTNRHRECFERV